MKLTKLGRRIELFSFRMQCEFDAFSFVSRCEGPVSDTRRSDGRLARNSAQTSPATRRSIRGEGDAPSAILGCIGLLLLGPTALADTCCANTPVEFHPGSAIPGDVVRVSDVQCLNSDNSGPLPLKLAGFWLSPGSCRDPDPDTAPGPGAPASMPDPATWPAFDGVTPAALAYQTSPGRHSQRIGASRSNSPSGSSAAPSGSRRRRASARRCRRACARSSARASAANRGARRSRTRPCRACPARSRPR